MNSLLSVGRDPAKPSARLLGPPTRRFGSGRVSQRLLAGVLAITLLSGCTYVDGDPTVIVASEPAGAEILLDGQPTGQTTPARLDLDGLIGSNHDILLRKQGFTDERRTVFHYRTESSSRWVDGATEMGLWSFPLFWTFGDFFTPFELRHRYVPHELFVRLYKEGEGPVQSLESGAGSPTATGTR